MILYLDIIFLINIWFDFLLLLTVSILLKRNTKFIRIILASLIGGITIFILFLNLNDFELFIFKIIISILMIITAFSYKNLKYTLNNLSYFYLVSIVLGGGLYLLNDMFGYDNQGLVFYHNGFYINYILLIIISPLIILFYYYKCIKLNKDFSNHYQVDLLINNKTYKLNGYLDTGNNLYDPYKKRGVILVNIDIELENKDIIYVPFESLNNHGLVKCIKADKIFINKHEIKNYLIGFSSEKFKIDGIDCILHNKLKGEIL